MIPDTGESKQQRKMEERVWIKVEQKLAIMRRELEQQLAKDLAEVRNRLEHRLEEEFTKRRSELEQWLQEGTATVPFTSTGMTDTSHKSHGAKLAALAFVRSLIKARDFHIASNMEVAGSFKDIVLKFRHHTIFVQLKCSETSTQELDFSLLQFYECYRALKEQWSQNKDLAICGRFEDVLFVVHTTARLTTAASSTSDCAEWQDVLNTGGRCGSLVEDMESVGDSSECKEFLSRLWFFTEQATEAQLDDLVKQEIKTAFGSDAMYPQLRDKVEAWWLCSDTLLTHQTQFWLNIVQSCNDNVSKQKHKQVQAFNVTFNRDQCTLVRTLLMFSQILHVIPDETDVSSNLSCLKVHQALVHDKHLLVDKDALQDCWNEVTALWGRWCDLLILDAPDTADVDALVSILQRHPQKRLILVGRSTAWNKVPHKCTLQDHITLSHLDAELQAQILAAPVQFQGHDVPLGTILDRDHNLVPIDIIVQVLTDKLVVGEALPRDIDYYIPRTLCPRGRDSVLFRNVDLVDSVPFSTVLVSAGPGTGKSTLLTHVALGTKEAHPEMWVIKANLGDFAQQLDEFPWNSQLSNAAEFLLEVTGISPEWKQLFCSKLHNVCVFVDGHDEVSDSQANKVILMLKCLQLGRVRNIWVATGDDFIEKLETELNTTALTPRPFSETEQRNFLVTFWRKSKPEEPVLDSFIDTILHLKPRTLSIIGNPLQSMLFAEVYESTLKDSGQPQKLDLFELYSKFVGRRLGVTGNRRLENHMISALLATLPKAELERHSNASAASRVISFVWSVVLSVEQQSEVKDLRDLQTHVEPFLKDIQRGQGTGIINKIVNNKPVFIHRTFCEFFAALWFARNLNQFREYLRWTFFNPSSRIVRYFLNRALSENCELHVAVLNQDTALVKDLLSTQDINRTDGGGRTALHLAVMNFTDVQDEESREVLQDIVELLLTHGADPGVQDRVLCHRPLRLADTIGAPLCVIDALLGRQADDSDLVITKKKVCNVECLQDMLRAATRQAFVHLVALLLKCGVRAWHPLVVRHDDSRVCKATMLHEAARYGHLSLVELLTENKADLEARDSEYERTVLMWAATQDEVPVVEFLIQHGADTSARDRHGNTALLVAALNGKLNTLQRLSQASDVTVCDNEGNNALHCAAMSGNVQLVAHLLNGKLDMNSRNNSGRTPLWRAAGHGHVHSTDLLCQNGADVHVQDSKYEYTALHIAARLGHLQVVQCLVRHGACLDTYDCQGRTPLDVAVRSKKADVVEFLKHVHHR